MCELSFATIAPDVTSTTAFKSIAADLGSRKRSHGGGHDKSERCIRVISGPSIGEVLEASRPQRNVNIGAVRGARCEF